MPIPRVVESMRHTLGAALDLESLRTTGTLPGGWRLDEVDVEQGITLLLRGPNASLVVELEGRDPSRPCFAATERFNVYYRCLDTAEVGGAETRLAVLEALVALLRRREHRLPLSPPVDVEAGRVIVREVEVDRGLVPEGERAYYLNPYVGCMLACPFCYASHRAHFSRSLEGAATPPWGKWVDVKVNLPSVVAREVRTLDPGTVRISPIVTDPYQPLERRYRVTRRCLEAMVDTSFVPIVLTRASLVLEDVELLLRCRSLVGISVPTDDDDVRAAFEPSTESIQSRLDTLRALKDAGLRTFAIVQPMLPLEPDFLVDRLAGLVDAVRIGPMFEKARIAPVYARVGREDALEPGWELRTLTALSAGFSARGVAVNPTAGEWSVLR
jgi:DNA repair photolyase